MKTDELIDLLKRLDPDNECEVFMDGCDIYRSSCMRLPYYYDGLPEVAWYNEHREIQGFTPLQKGHKIVLRSACPREIFEQGLETQSEVWVQVDELPYHDQLRWHRDRTRWATEHAELLQEFESEFGPDDDTKAERAFSLQTGLKYLRLARQLSQEDECFECYSDSERHRRELQQDLADLERRLLNIKNLRSYED
jgi:hypothetical protein